VQRAHRLRRRHRPRRWGALLSSSLLLLASYGFPLGVSVNRVHSSLNNCTGTDLSNCSLGFSCVAIQTRGFDLLQNQNTGYYEMELSFLVCLHFGFFKTAEDSQEGWFRLCLFLHLCRAMRQGKRVLRHKDVHFPSPPRRRYDPCDKVTGSRTTDQILVILFNNNLVCWMLQYILLICSCLN
jgi:hypothetical protein